MYIFGGQRSLDQNNNWTYCYNIEKDRWRIIKPDW
jgi:hypothetical protein